MSRTVTAVQLGRLGFQQAWQCQKYCEKLHLQRKPEDTGPSKNTLLLVEHDPVYTIGLRTKDYSETDAQRLRAVGAEFYRTNRGGLITFHGPGQLVMYPIINLKDFKIGMREYVNRLEQTVIGCCSALGLEGVTSPHTGVWVNERKIAAIGVHGRRYITTHGVGINCNTDMDWFKHIVPCGIVGKEVTSFTEELGRETTIKDVVPVLLKAFSAVFDCDISEIQEKDMFVDLKTIESGYS